MSCRILLVMVVVLVGASAARGQTPAPLCGVPCPPEVRVTWEYKHECLAPPRWKITTEGPGFFSTEERGLLWKKTDSTVCGPCSTVREKEFSFLGIPLCRDTRVKGQAVIVCPPPMIMPPCAPCR